MEGEGLCGRVKPGLGWGTWEQGADTGPPWPGPSWRELTGTRFASLPSFPSEHFGKLFGLVMALSAIVSLLQFPIFTFIKGPLQNDPLYVSTWVLGVWPWPWTREDIRIGVAQWGPSRGRPKSG